MGDDDNGAFFLVMAATMLVVFSLCNETMTVRGTRRAEGLYARGTTITAASGGPDVELTWMDECRCKSSSVQCKNSSLCAPS